MLNRSVAPATQEISSVQLLPAEIEGFANGSRLHTIFNNTQPILKFEIVLKAGKWYEPYSGVAYLTAKMLLEGTKSYSSQQIAEVIAYYGASLECNQGFDRSTITLYCLTKHFNSLIQLVAEILFSPTFPEKEFDLLKIRTIQNISVEKKKNSYLANQIFTRNIYGQAHPYVSGTDETVLSEITLQDIKEFYSNFYHLAQAEMFLCGDFTAENLLATTTLFSENRTAPPVTSYQKKIIRSGLFKKDFFIKEDSLQSSIRVGGPWPLISDPDYHSLFILNKILGGYFGSRLMKNIREDKGFTYGIYSTVSVKEHDNIYFIGTDVNYQNTQQTLDEIYKEINRLKTEPISVEELNTVQNYALGKFANDLSTIFDQSEKYKNLILHNLPLSFYTDYITSVKECDPIMLMNLANSYYLENSMFEVVVGKKSE